MEYGGIVEAMLVVTIVDPAVFIDAARLDIKTTVYLPLLGVGVLAP